MKKCTFIFEQSGTLYNGQAGREAGWTESWYANPVDIGADTSTFFAVTWMQSRAQLLSLGGRMVGFRWHDLATNATVSRYTTVPGVAPQNDMPQMAVLGRAYSDSPLTNTRAVELRGFPDAWVVKGELQEFATFKSAWLQFSTMLSQQGWRFQGVDKSIPKYKVKSISAGGAVVLGEPAVGLVAGVIVKFYRTRLDATCCGSIGEFEILSNADDTHFTLKDYSEGAASGGKVGIKPGIVYPAVKYATYERSDVRKAGRPFDLFRGRTSRKCCKC